MAAPCLYDLYRRRPGDCVYTISSYTLVARLTNDRATADAAAADGVATHHLDDFRYPLWDFPLTVGLTGHVESRDFGLEWYLMRGGIEPLWEAPEHSKGGKLSLILPVADRLAAHNMFMIAVQAFVRGDMSRDITGIVIVPRPPKAAAGAGLRRADTGGGLHHDLQIWMSRGPAGPPANPTLPDGVPDIRSIVAWKYTPFPPSPAPVRVEKVAPVLDDDGFETAGRDKKKNRRRYQ